VLTQIIRHQVNVYLLCGPHNFPTKENVELFHTNTPGGRSDTARVLTSAVRHSARQCCASPVFTPMSHLRFCRTSLTHDSDAHQSRIEWSSAVLYSENESRDCATRHDATCDTPCHTCDPLSRVKVAQLCRRCDIGLRPTTNCENFWTVSGAWTQSVHVCVFAV